MPARGRAGPGAEEDRAALSGLLVVETAALCARVGRGDREAFGVLYEAWFERCYAMARGFTRRDESFCLDVVQETMLRVARRIPAMRGEAELARWMVRAVHSSAIDLLRREARARTRERAAAAREVDGIGDGASEAAAGEWLERALRDVDEQERAMLQLRYGRDATLEEVGRSAGVSGDAAHGRLRRLIQRLRGSWVA
ncbi:MAG: sigma-70 family RNA polymerase sigma factor [Phycisphaerales bacterium]